MNVIDKLVLPFKWSEFGSWLTNYRQVALASPYGSLSINGTTFSAGSKGLDGINISVELCFNEAVAPEIYLCGFLADLEHQQLFEPFIGNPDSGDTSYHACRKVGVNPGIIEAHSLFIPEAGWVLPSIWRFLVQSLGLKSKNRAQMPDIVVLALSPGQPGPLLFGSQPFDYYGEARRFKEELLLGEFFRQLHVDANAPEGEIQRAYILHCRDSQSQASTSEDSAHRQSHVNRLRQGYQLWTEKLQHQREIG